MTTPNPGRLALIRVLQSVPASFVADVCAVTPRAVRRWASGERKPGERERIALVRFRIDVAAWR